MKTFLVTGGRTFGDLPEEVKYFYDTMHVMCERSCSGLKVISYDDDRVSEYHGLHIICGGATGADSLAVEFAKEFGIPYTVFPAEWKKFGKYAGPARNAQMIKEGKPDLVIAFPGGKGTADMIEQAQENFVPIAHVKMSPKVFKKGDFIYCSKCGKHRIDNKTLFFCENFETCPSGTTYLDYKD